MEKSIYFGVQMCGSTIDDIVRKLFDKRPAWRRCDMVVEVEREYLALGGVLGIQKTGAIVKRVLANLNEKGLIFKPSKYSWKKYDSCFAKPEAKAQAPAPATEMLDPDIDSLDLDDKDTVRRKFVCEPEDSIGEGSENVYVYFERGYRDLANKNCDPVWPCKVGRSDDVIRRISEGNAAFLFNPVIGLVVKCHNSSAVERILHKILFIAERKNQHSVGQEWYLTSPKIIKEVYEKICQCVELCSIRDIDKQQGTMISDALLFAQNGVSK